MNRGYRPCSKDHRRRRTHYGWLPAAALSAVMFLVSPALHAAPAPIDACALLAADQVSAVVGKSVEITQPFDNGITPQGAHSTTCIWAVPLPPGVEPDPTKRLGGRGFVVVSVMNWPGGPNDARKFLDDFQRAFQEHGIESKPVAVNVGADDALWWGDGVAARSEEGRVGEGGRSRWAADH